jgi:hypothetical protein
MPSLKLRTQNYSSSQAHDVRFVGWVERSETQQQRAIMLGFAPQPNLRKWLVLDQEPL